MSTSCNSIMRRRKSIIAVIAVIVIACMSLVNGNTLQPTLALTMICRDEAVNLKSNLAKWRNFADYYIFLVDSRTSDLTVSVINTILGHKPDNYKVINYTFNGFGQARTSSLEATWNNFPQASHVLVADPDWSPRVETIDKSELDFVYDVFRFIAFDRNGHTNRRMDWLLRNKPNLKMRYSLHEVLDIGLYTVKTINWVVDEIEQPGSWHSSVGHGNSVSSKRYKFDLDLLQQDLKIYGHDPHTHYYLGVTYQAFAEKMYLEKKVVTPEIDQSLELSIKYLTIRATTEYSDHFVEERWASMYTLGSIYANEYKSDFRNGIYWFKMCRDYNPQQVECSMSLIKLYLSHGVFDLALFELETILRVKNTPRMMLNYHSQYLCELPVLALTLYSNKAILGALTAEEAFYSVLLRSMAKSDHCKGTEVVFPEQFRNILQQHFTSEQRGVARNDLIRFDSPQRLLCSNKIILSYLLENKIQLHPCEESMNALILEQECTIMNALLAPAYEGLHVTLFSEGFIGTSSLFDIIHHIYNGESKKVTTSKPFRILFAEFFHPSAVYNLIGHLERNALYDVEVWIVHPLGSHLTNLLDKIQICSAKLSIIRHIKIKTIPHTLDEFLEQSVRKIRRLQENKQEVNPNKYYFDYIEYNGGLSRSPNATNHLKLMFDLLKDSGGIDYELIEFLGGEKHPLSYVPTHLHNVPPPAQWKAWHQDEVTSTINQCGFKIISFVPTAFSHPFDKMYNYEVSKFFSAGMDQQTFIERYMINFRYSFYAVKNSNPLSSLVLGGYNDLPVDKIFVIDRTGVLGSSFTSVVDRAANGMSTSFIHAHYSHRGQFNISFTLMPSISACFPHLSSVISISSLHEINLNFTKAHSAMIVTTEEIMKIELMNVIRHFISLNVITLWSVDGPIPNVANPEVENPLMRFREMQHNSSANNIRNNVNKYSINQIDKIFIEEDITGQNSIINEQSQPKFMDMGGILIDFESNKLKSNERKIDELVNLAGNVNNNRPVPPSQGSFQMEENKNIINKQSNPVSSIKRSPTVEEIKNRENDDLLVDMINELTSSYHVNNNPHNGQTANKDHKDATIERKVNKNQSPLHDLEKEAKIVKMKLLGFSDEFIQDLISKQEIIHVRKRTEDSDVIEIRRNPNSSDVSDTNSHSHNDNHNDNIQVKTGNNISNKNNDESVISNNDAEMKIKKMKKLGFSDEYINQYIKRITKEEKPKKTSDSLEVKNDYRAEVNNPPVSSSSTEGVDMLSLKKDILNFLKEKRNVNNNGNDVIDIEAHQKSSSTSKLFVQNNNNNFNKKLDINKNNDNELDESLFVFSSKAVQLPSSIVTKEKLLKSYRRVECINNERLLDCDQESPPKRKTAGLKVSSYAKIEFDIIQLLYLESLGLVNDVMLSKNYDIKQKYIDIYDSWEKLEMSSISSHSNKVKVISNDYLSSMINHIIKLTDFEESSSPMDENSSYFHLGAVQRLISVIDIITQNDFFVLDTIIKNEYIHKLNIMLMKSTIWFDVTNGNAFASHYDDSLYFKSFSYLAQQIAFSLSSSKKKMRVIKYFALAMLFDGKGAASPVMMGNREEVTAVIWLNPMEEAVIINPDITPPSFYSDGLLICAQTTASKLFSKGVSVYPSTHSDFLSRANSLEVDLTPTGEACDPDTSEIIPRQINRLVVIRSRRPFVLTTPYSLTLQQQYAQEKNFQNKVMIAFVVVLT
eukprot:gene5866-8090_t